MKIFLMEIICTGPEFLYKIRFKIWWGLWRHHVYIFRVVGVERTGGLKTRSVCSHRLQENGEPIQNVNKHEKTRHKTTPQFLHIKPHCFVLFWFGLFVCWGVCLFVYWVSFRRKDLDCLMGKTTSILNKLKHVYQTES